jgi:hypothetical protein
MNNPILKITDGSTTVDLLDLRGWLLNDWSPAVPEPKGGGVFRNSPLVDGRKLAYRKIDNITDTFNLIGSRESQDQMIASIQKLQQLLEKAVSYWITSWQNEPVWIEAKATNETASRYATIVDYRLTGFGGPYKQPFFSSDCNSATEAILVIEHMVWQETEPGEPGTCAQSSSLYYSEEIATYATGTFYPSASAEDCTVQNFIANESVTPAGIDLTNVNIGVGWSSILAWKCDAGIIFNNVTIPRGSIILKATLTLHAGVISIGTATLKISGQSTINGDAVAFTTADDFFTRTRTDEFQIISLEDGQYPGAIDITNIVQEIIGKPTTNDPSIWTSGDKMGMFVSLYSGEGGREFDSFNSGVPANYPKLIIEYATTGADIGRSATCYQETMVSNKMNRAVITNAYWYDANTGNYSTNLTSAAPPYGLLPNGGGLTPAVGDMLYLGSDTSHTDGGPFNNAAFDITVLQSGITAGVWQYYKGAPTNAWTAFDVAGTATNELCGDAQLFLTSGVTSIVFKPSANWAEIQVTDGIDNDTGYWIRFVVSAISGGTVAPVQGNRQIYTAINPYIDIDEAQVPGDIPALARILFDSCTCWQRSMNTLVMGLRSLSRGIDFAAYLNCSETQNPIGSIFEVIQKYGTVHLQDDPETPTGSILDLTGFHPYTSGYYGLTPVCKWTFTSGLAKQYLGVYHAFVRCWFDAGIGTVSLRLKAVFGEEYNVSFSDINSPSLDGSICAIDLGQLTILPSYTLRPDDNIDIIKIYLEAYSETDADFTNAYVYDIILIPADEWSGNFGMPKITGTSVLRYGQGLDIDGITNPRQFRAEQTEILINSKTYTDSNRNITASWSRIASSEPIFQANADQRLWFFQYKQQAGLVSYFENCGKVCVQRSARYILMRGDK